MSLDKLCESLLSELSESNSPEIKEFGKSMSSNKELMKDTILGVAGDFDVPAIRQAVRAENNPFQVNAVGLAISVIACCTSMGLTKEDIDNLMNDVWKVSQNAFEKASKKGRHIALPFIESGLAKAEDSVGDSKWGKS